MTKSELIARISKANPHLYPRHVEIFVNAIFDEITSALAEGKRVELRDFGVFSVKRLSARTARNPKTGEPVSVEEKLTLHFKSGKSMHLRLNKPGG